LNFLPVLSNPPCPISFAPFWLFLRAPLSRTFFLLKISVVSSSTFYPTLPEQSLWSVIRLPTYYAVLSGDVSWAGVTFAVFDVPGCQCSKVLHVRVVGRSQQLQKFSFYFGSVGKGNSLCRPPKLPLSYPATSRMMYPTIAAEPSQKVRQKIGLRNWAEFLS
jgi:hypothetical protein